MCLSLSAECSRKHALQIENSYSVTNHVQLVVVLERAWRECFHAPTR
jgi:hypothetical protein